MKFNDKNLVHAHDSCACARMLCMHKNHVHEQESCAYTEILCMHKILVYAQQLHVKSMLFVKTSFFHEWAPYGGWEGHPAAKIRVVAMHVFLFL